jgi:type IV secretory pathway VirJ component
MSLASARPWLISVVALLGLAAIACAALAVKLDGPWLIRQPSPAGGDLAIIYSGDGGWVALDDALARALADSGRSVVGVDALRYFWRPRPSQPAAQDLAQIIREHGGDRRRGVVLVGYSFGADALPIIVRDLPAEARARIAALVLVGPEAKGDLEFRPSQWWGAHTSDAYDVAAVVGALKGVPITCIYGMQDRRHAACPGFAAPVRKVGLPGGHHFNGDFTGLRRALAAALP